MKIVVLDGAALNPGDLNWDELEQLGETTVYDRTDESQLLSRAAWAEVVITNKVPLDAPSIRALSRLRYIGITATGYNIVDTAAAKEAGVTVTNVPAYSTHAVAQATFALLLELTNHVGELDREVRTRWPASRDWCYWDEPIVELAGLSLGIIGYGRIGAAVGRIGRAMGMGVCVTTRRSDPGGDVVSLDVDAVFSRCDVVTLHCPLTEQTQGMVSAERLARMKPTSLLINTSRGPLIDERALAKALHDGRIAGAGLDVLSMEPPPPDHPLLSAPRCIITPHVAWAAAASRQRLLAATIENLRAFVDGSPQNVVN